MSNLRMRPSQPQDGYECYFFEDQHGEVGCLNGPQSDDRGSLARKMAVGPEMYEAMAEFCRRVECGEVRSKKTYASFKAILAKAEGTTHD